VVELRALFKVLRRKSKRGGNNLRTTAMKRGTFPSSVRMFACLGIKFPRSF
jgi:hypothetical protein